MAKVRGKKARGFFDYEFRKDEIKNQQTSLEKLNTLINWEKFRSTIEGVFDKQSKGPGGAPAFDRLFMFKILVLQRYFNLSDAQTEFQIKDRISFQSFLGLDICDDVPDEKTIWYFREQLIHSGALKYLFEMFTGFLDDQGIISKEGSIVDASFVEAPRQRNSREENKQIKEGAVPEAWKEKQSKLSQKDTDAKWTKKNNEVHYGYKNHVKVDKKTKLIQSFTVTDASVHDSQTVADMINEGDKELYGDSAYKSEAIDKELGSKHINNQVHEKGYRNKPLTEIQKAGNKIKSKIRVRVEHVFGFIENSMKGSNTRYIGFKRNKTRICITNLVYNLFRYEQIMRLNLAGAN